MTLETKDMSFLQTDLLTKAEPVGQLFFVGYTPFIRLRNLGYLLGNILEFET
jgi:hypothetical protein